MYHCIAALRMASMVFVRLELDSSKIDLILKQLTGFLEALINEQPGFDILIVCPGYLNSESDDKKVVADGTLRTLNLNVDRSKFMSAQV